jgi:GTP-binding protein
MLPRTWSAVALSDQRLPAWPVGAQAGAGSGRSRHGLKDVDREIMAMLDKAAVGYHLVLTKADKIKPTALIEVLEATKAEAARHPAAHPLLFATSSETGEGIAELRTAILEAALS